MRIILYGLPCAGKTTLLSEAKNLLSVINGGEELKKFSGSIETKRKQFLQELGCIDDYFIDGHYEFITDDKKEVAFTSENKIFDVFMYLYQSPSVLYNRMSTSCKNRKYLPTSIDDIKNWQLDEINNLREICHESDKDFYIIDDWESNFKNFIPFCKDVIDGFSNVHFAKEIVSKIDFSEKDLSLFDGDKTLISYDTSRTFLNFTTDIFDNNFYTGYQFWLQDKIIRKDFNKSAVENTIFNNGLNQDLLHRAKNAIILSSGLSEIWNDIIGQKYGIKVFSGKKVSAETKYFVAKFLKKKYTVTAYGDSKNDLFMLREADTGYIVIYNHLSRSLLRSEIAGLKIINFNQNFTILSDDESISEPEKGEILNLVEITKSDSGINGNRLAKAHFELGNKISRYFSSIPENDTTVISFERSGHFFADGIYMNFNGRFESYNSKIQDFPQLKTKNVVLVDGVINNGKSMLATIDKIEQQSRDIKITIVANVINKDAVELFNVYDLFVVRVSDNKFTGSNVRTQVGNIGPDTADRLFNQLN